MERATKREFLAEGESDNGSSREQVHERRVLRSRYLAVKNLISDEREDITRIDSAKFSSIITEVEGLHQLVQKPREQVADAEALLDITNTLVTSVKSQSSDGITPSDFVSALLMNFGHQDGIVDATSAPNMVSWSDIGLAVSNVFSKASGCCTMVGPMSTEMKQRKPVVHRKRSRPTESTHPEELDNAETEAKTDTDKNMSTMFDILRRKRTVKLDSLVLNRISFAQTVENIFALSFLVKDGRAAITVNDRGHHFVSPKNAPSAAAVASGDVLYNHFVFRFDFKDWKLMKETVAVGEELMPHRTSVAATGGSSSSSQRQGQVVHTTESQACGGGAAPPPTTPIRKLTRSRGLVIQEDAVVQDSIEKDQPPSSRRVTRHTGKRLCNDFNN